MLIPKFNWPIWAGLFLSIVAFLSYPLFFARFPVTRDFPWANLLLALAAVALLVVGMRRAFAPGRPRRAKVAGIAIPALSAVILGFFIFMVFIMARWLPSSTDAPKVGQKAPEFSLTDASGRVVSLAELLSSPVGGKPPKGVLLVFYRGYW